MLTISKNVTIVGVSATEDGTEAMRMQATISSDNPEDINISSWQLNKSAYKDNRIECRIDYANFEEIAYAAQEELIAMNK